MINQLKQIHYDHASVRLVELPRFLHSLTHRASPIQSKHPHQSEFDEARVGLPGLCLISPIHKDAPMKHSILQTLVLLESIACSHSLPRNSRPAICSFQRACHAANRAISCVVLTSVTVFGLEPSGVKQPTPKGSRTTISNQDRPVVKSVTVCISQQPC